MQQNEFLSNYINTQLINNPNILNDKLYFKNKKLNEREEVQKIKTYIDEFITDNPIHRFIVLPGLRGVGKSTMLFQTYDYLLRDKKIAPNQILYFSCEELNYLGSYTVLDVVNNFLKNYHETDLMTLNKNIFLLIDESQYDKNWALAGKIIYDKTQRIFMIFTGSSALNLETNGDASRRMFKININPLNYSQYLKLKYNLPINRVSNLLEKIMFDADIQEAMKYEKHIHDQLINTPKYNTYDWENYVKHGGFPTSFHINSSYEQETILMDIISKIVHNDIAPIKNFTTENQVNVTRVLSYLALQRANDLSQPKLSKHLQTSVSNIKNILDTLEKTHLIFHVEAYGTSSKRSKKSWKYYFASSSLKHTITTTLGNNTIRNEEYEGILLENLVAATLFENLFKPHNLNSHLYYDSNKQNVDFLIQKGFQNLIPIEVGRGKKDKKQVMHAMDNYESSHAIIISNTTSKIYKEDDIIYLPPKTFSIL